MRPSIWTSRVLKCKPTQELFEYWRHLGPVAEVEAGAVQQVVVGRGEAVHQVQGEAAHRRGQGVQRHPPHLVHQETENYLFIRCIFFIFWNKI